MKLFEAEINPSGNCKAVSPLPALAVQEMISRPLRFLNEVSRRPFWGAGTSESVNQVLNVQRGSLSEATVERRLSKVQIIWLFELGVVW